MLLKNIFAGIMFGKNHKKLSPNDIRDRLKNFLLNFEDFNSEAELSEPYDRFGKHKYMIMLQKIANEHLKVMEVHLEDIEDYFRKAEEKVIIDGVKSNVKRYVELLQDITDQIIPKRTIDINPEDTLRFQLENALMKQRQENYRMSDDKLLSDNQKIPQKMNRKHSVIICYKQRKPNMVKAISEIGSEMMGSLVIIKGIVIRTDEVRPRLSVGTFACDVCGCENYMEIFNDKYTPLQNCQSKKCLENTVNGKLTFVPKNSHFIPSQEIAIQEVPEQLKQGNIPRNLKLVLTDHNIKSAHPGDIIQIQGVVLPRRKEKSSHDEDILFDSRMEAFKVSNQKKRYVDMQITEEDVKEIEEIRGNHTDDDLFKKLASSIAPEIYGMEYVKKALLLQLAGGVTAVTNDNMKIRGEINVMLVGDPGVAKSQLLKYISCMAPRGIYTTGKGSSGVGLTAAVKIDPSTRDVSLQAGALVLADMGVCCIDEFDKMEEYDKTAIHEVMEQQTVSIAKAGLTTTLNARTSVLAAANPLFSRYNPNETAEKNINLQPALLSRFDLIFILLDKTEGEKDLQLARHIAKVHQKKQAPDVSGAFDVRTLRNYIALSKDYEPKISPKLTSLIVQRYVKKRIYYSDFAKKGERYITARNLLALIRLCQARARLRFSNDISEEDIMECQEIMAESQKNVNPDNEARKEIKDDISSIFSLIKEMSYYRTEEVIDNDILLKKIQAKGYSRQALDKTLRHYSNMGIISVDNQGRVSLIETLMEQG